MGTVKRRSRKRTTPEDISQGAWALINDEPQPDDEDDNWDYWFLDSYESKQVLWERFGEQVMEGWLANSPGTRPSCWWLYEAPRGDPGRHKEWYFADRIIETRRLLEGNGRPAWDRYSYAPSYAWGIPALWTEGDPDGLVFESQYSYLKRHGLLQRGEHQDDEVKFVPRSVDLHD